MLVSTMGIGDGARNSVAEAEARNLVAEAEAKRAQLLTTPKKRAAPQEGRQ